MPAGNETVQPDIIQRVWEEFDSPYPYSRNVPGVSRKHYEGTWEPVEWAEERVV